MTTPPSGCGSHRPDGGMTSYTARTSISSCSCSISAPRPQLQDRVWHCVQCHSPGQPQAYQGQRKATAQDPIRYPTPGPGRHKILPRLVTGTPRTIRPRDGLNGPPPPADWPETRSRAHLAGQHFAKRCRHSPQSRPYPICTPTAEPTPNPDHQHQRRKSSDRSDG